MDKKVLGANLAEKFGLASKKMGIEIVEFIFEEIASTLAKKEEVNIASFGKFVPKVSPARKGFNPKTKEEISIPEKTKAVLKPAKPLKDRLV